MKITSSAIRLRREFRQVTSACLSAVAALCLLLALTGYARGAIGPILVVGDSLSAAYGLAIEDGWVARLHYRLEGTRHMVNVVNASVSGDTSANGRSRLPTLLEKHKPSIVIVELGGNDGLRGLSIKKLKQNLLDMADMAKESGAKVIILGMKIPGNYGAAYTRLFHDSFASVASDTDGGLVPFLLAGLEGSGDWFQSDGIHPNAAAQEVMLDNVWPILESMLDALEK